MRRHTNASYTCPCLHWTALTCLFHLLIRSSNAFMHAPTLQRTHQLAKNDNNINYTRRQAFFPGNNNNNNSIDRISSNLISQLAIIALKLRLAGQDSVDCFVTAPTEMMLFQQSFKVGPVTVRGRGWRSNLNLSCRAIEATVEACQLDLQKILTRQKLYLTVPAKGRAMIALNSVDFGNFIVHPFMQQSIAKYNDKQIRPIEFVKTNTIVNPVDGTVIFGAKYDNVLYECSLRRGSSNLQKAVIDAKPMITGEDSSNGDSSKELSRLMTDFFNTLVFELDGTFLSFRDMMVTDRGDNSCVMLSLNITVEKFPSPGLEF